MGIAFDFRRLACGLALREDNQTMRFLALLRGINVGGRNKLPMADLRALALELGYTEVDTYIQSGNLLFQGAGAAQGHEAVLEAGIQKRFGLTIPVLVRSAAQFQKMPATNPFQGEVRERPQHVMLLLSKRKPKADVATTLMERATDGEQVQAFAGGLWLFFANGAGRSKWSPALLDRLVGSHITTRNWNTVLQLVERLDS